MAKKLIFFAVILLLTVRVPNHCCHYCHPWWFPADETRSPLLESTLKLLAIETAEQHLGSRIVVSWLADVLFVQAIRAHCLREQMQQGWIATLADSKLSGVVKQMHNDIARPWSLQMLAHDAGMSRSSFAVHFKTVTGKTPGDYLTSWRMYRTRCLLRHPQLTLANIAARVGYDSAITLGRAFKRFTGMAPGKYRQQAGRPLSEMPENQSKR